MSISTNPVRISESTCYVFDVFYSIKGDILQLQRYTNVVFIHNLDHVEFEKITYNTIMLREGREYVSCMCTRFTAFNEEQAYKKANEIMDKYKYENGMAVVSDITTK